MSLCFTVPLFAFFCQTVMQAHQSEKIQDGVPFIAVDRQRFCQKRRFVVIFAGAHEEISDFRMFRIQLPDDPVSQVETGGKLIQQPFLRVRCVKLKVSPLRYPRFAVTGLPFSSSMIQLKFLPSRISS